MATPMHPPATPAVVPSALVDALFDQARQNRGLAGMDLRLLSLAPGQAAKAADVLYTDVWTSMGEEAERAQRRHDLAGYQINKELLAHAAKDALVMHCLPAHRGEEITADVFEAHADVIFDEAENRLHTQKAIMALTMAD